MPKPPAQQQKDLTTTLQEGTPLQRLFGDAFEELGGQDFFVQWAEDNPTAFIQMLIAQQPPAHQPNASNTANVINIHPGLAPGPLDEKVVSDQ